MCRYYFAVPSRACDRMTSVLFTLGTRRQPGAVRLSSLHRVVLLHDGDDRSPWGTPFEAKASSPQQDEDAQPVRRCLAAALQFLLAGAGSEQREQESAY